MYYCHIYTRYIWTRHIQIQFTNFDHIAIETRVSLRLKARPWEQVNLATKHYLDQHFSLSKYYLIYRIYMILNFIIRDLYIGKHTNTNFFYLGLWCTIWVTKQSDKTSSYTRRSSYMLLNPFYFILKCQIFPQLITTQKMQNVDLFLCIMLQKKTNKTVWNINFRIFFEASSKSFGESWIKEHECKKKIRQKQ